LLVCTNLFIVNPLTVSYINNHRVSMVDIDMG